MKAKEIILALKNLAMSQGFYGRVYNAIWNDCKARNIKMQQHEIIQDLEGMHFGDVVDMVLYMEG